MQKGMTEDEILDEEFREPMEEPASDTITDDEV